MNYKLFVKYTLLTLFTLSSSLLALKAQERPVIDSLQNELNSYEAHKHELGRNAPPLMDTNKANLLYAIAFEYWGTVPDTGVYYALQVLSLSQNMGYEKGVGNAYNVMGLSYMQIKNFSVALDYYQKALKIRTDIGDKKGLAATCNNLGLMYGNMGEVETSIKWHTKSLKIKEEIGDRRGMGASYGKIGNDYFDLGKFPEAVTNFLKGLKIFEETGDKLQASGFYRQIGNVYYSVGNYQEALTNFLHELKIARELADTWQIAVADNNLGKIYYKQGNDTGAIRYMLASVKIFEEGHNLWDMENVHYNLGLVYIAMGNYPLALSYADSALKECQVMGSRLAFVNVYIETGIIYEKEGKLQDALNAVSNGLQLAKQMGLKVEMQDAYSHLADINAEMKNYKGAYESYKDYVVSSDSIRSNESSRKIATLEMNYAFEKREDSIRAEQEKIDIIKTAESNRKSIITGSSIVISILTILMAILLINRLQIKRKKDKIIFEKEKQQVELELASAKKLLDEYMQSMAEKNRLLEEFKADVEEFQNLYDKDRKEKLEYLNKATILTDEDWNKFKQLFEHVHKDFLKRLKEKLPDLTQAEIRLICLTKLNTGTKPMAAILGVSLDTIKKSRHRLRRKLALPEEDSIDEVVNAI